MLVSQLPQWWIRQLERTEYTITTVDGNFCDMAFTTSTSVPPDIFRLKKVCSVTTIEHKGI